MVRVHLQRIFMRFPSLAWLNNLARKLEELHGIPHIIEAIDGSQIPILALIIEGGNYYYY